jgi:ABC-2 type transport system ATP-binding protein
MARKNFQDMEMQKTSATNKAEEDIVIWSENLTKRFGHEAAVIDVNLSIPKGSIFGFIGPSGCGKTTTVRLLTGVYKPTNGQAKVFGIRPEDFTRTERERLGYLVQQFILYPDLTVSENLNFAASLYGVSLRRKERLGQLLEFVELGEHKNKLVRNLSGGMQRRLSLASTLVHDPEILFLDEPTAGIDPILRRKFWDYFAKLQNEGRTLFITTQYVGEAAYCDLVGVMMQGRLLMVDTPAGLRRRAYGGDVILLRTLDPIDHDQAEAFEGLNQIQARIIQRSDHELQIVVDEAGVALPVLLQCCNRQNLQIEAIEEYLPPFDDVFVKLIEEQIVHD